MANQLFRFSNDFWQWYLSELTWNMVDESKLRYQSNHNNFIEGRYVYLEFKQLLSPNRKMCDGHTKYWFSSLRNKKIDKSKH